MSTSNQPELFPERTMSKILVKGSEADAAVARVRACGGVLLSFTPKPGGMIELHLLLDAAMLQQAMEGHEL